MSRIRLRPSTIADAPAVFALVNDAYAVEKGCSGTAFKNCDRYLSMSDAIADIQNKGASLIAMNEDDGCKIVGFVAASIVEGKCSVGPLAVAPARQGSGLGTRLLDSMCAFARASGTTVVSLDVVNHRSDLFVEPGGGYYGSRGFVKVGTRPCKQGSNCGESQCTRTSFFVKLERVVEEAVDWVAEPLGTFTFIDRNINRTIIDDEGCLCTEIVDGGMIELDRELLAKHLRRFHKEQERQFKLRREMCRTGVLDERGIGCAKCRWTWTGCERCGYKDNKFKHGPVEGMTGGIPFPSKEVDMQIVGSPGDGGGVCRPGLSVTSNTPICERIRSAIGADAGVWGLITTTDIREGDMVSEYVGEVMTMEQADLRERDVYRKRGLENSYAAHTGNHIIDSTFFGNCSRFINHSCEPNLKFAKWLPEGRSRSKLRHLPRVIFRAGRDIAAGEELTFDYGAIELTRHSIPRDDDEETNGGGQRRPKRPRRSSRRIQENPDEGQMECLCGAPTCRRWLA